MHLYLLRHADAESHASSDRERVLTANGHEQARAVGEFCRRQSVRPELILTSPYRRTVQTAEHVTAALSDGAAQAAAFLASGMEPEAALAELRAHQRLGGVMLVGHQPDLGMLAARLIGLASSENLPVSKASLLCIEVRRLATAGGSLEFLLPAKMMRLES